MSDTVKLIIEIDKRAYKACQELRTNNDDGIIGLCAVNAIAKGTPLDDVKAVIKQGRCRANNGYDQGRNYGLYMAEQILDNIVKAESEDRVEIINHHSIL